MELTDFNRWRKKYHTLTIKEQHSLHNRVVKEYPYQLYHNPAVFDYLFSALPDGLLVLELGGWDGALAEHIISSFQIEKWTNYEIAPDVKKITVCQRDNYELTVLKDKYIWDLEDFPDSDVFVSAHSIEHLSWKHARLLFKHIAETSNRFLAINAPLPMRGPVKWDNYMGFHILEVGWLEITEEVEQYGYKPVKTFSLPTAGGINNHSGIIFARHLQDEN